MSTAIFWFFVLLGVVFVLFAERIAAITECQNRKLFGIGFSRGSYRTGFRLAGCALASFGLAALFRR